MAEAPHRPAAFINAIADEGTKAEAVEWLQKEWNENCQLREQLAAARWIPVTEKLPDDDLTVMIAGKMDEPVWLGFHDDSGWYSVDAMPMRNMVTHWKPLPEPPHG